MDFFRKGWLKSTDELRSKKQKQNPVQTGNLVLSQMATSTMKSKLWMPSTKKSIRDHGINTTARTTLVKALVCTGNMASIYLTIINLTEQSCTTVHGCFLVCNPCDWLSKRQSLGVRDFADRRSSAPRTKRLFLSSDHSCHVVRHNSKSNF